MKDVKNKKLLSVIAITFLVIVVVVLQKNPSVLNSVNKTFLIVADPFSRIFISVSNKVKHAGDFVDNLFVAQEENEQLKKLLFRLETDNANLQELMAENNRLKDLLEFKEAQKNYKMKLARIISRDASQLKGNITIGLGAKEGIREYMPVVSEKGLVGSVLTVNDHSAQVQLITHPFSAVGALVQRAESRLVGIVTGDVGNNNRLNFSNLSKESDVVIGDVLVTSGFSGAYPKGLKIGRVESINNIDGGLLKQAIVVTDVKFDRLEEVMVIVNENDLNSKGLQ